ncbi:DUF4133 domain-containing protein [Lewinella sp. IMCC34191]|uniref:DUF4133 domain-containing protein n=1 Tax=Lewinella sp. IMCC34191 TaxID=2259172 RepID=UPI000E280ED0|nr:DUF4133 domain-containing protein [Lewinella sp. IMCC34191]
MRNYRVSRGVGKSPEIFGLSEKYLGYLALGLLLGFIGFFICRVLVSSNLIGILVFFLIIGLAFFYCQSMSVKHGEHGMAKQSAHQKRPRILVARTRSVFLTLKK